MSRLVRCAVSLGAVLLLGCSSGTVRYVSPYPSAWVKKEIAAFEKRTNETPSHVTLKVVYAGKQAYLIPSPCCDRFDFLYDSDGVILCAPSGGFGGRGDGSCPEVVPSAGARDL